MTTVGVATEAIAESNDGLARLLGKGEGTPLATLKISPAHTDVTMTDILAKLDDLGYWLDVDRGGVDEGGWVSVPAINRDWSKWIESLSDDDFVLVAGFPLKGGL